MLMLMSYGTGVLAVCNIALFGHVLPVLNVCCEMQTTHFPRSKVLNKFWQCSEHCGHEKWQLPAPAQLPVPAPALA